MPVILFLTESGRLPPIICSYIKAQVGDKIAHKNRDFFLGIESSGWIAIEAEPTLDRFTRMTRKSRDRLTQPKIESVIP
jgi:hypothetical protein